MSEQSTCLARADQGGVRYRPIPDFPGYCAGDDGTVWSCWRQVHLGYRYGSKFVLSDQWRQKIPTLSKRWGRFGVGIRRDGKQRFFWVHQLVLFAFVGPRPDDMECCHWDGNPLNNRLENLRWDTRTANQADQRRHGTRRTKLTEQQVLELRRLASSGQTCAELSRRFGVGYTTVQNIIKGRKWSHLLP